MLKFLLIF